jgi:hypothetical protein
MTEKLTEIIVEGKISNLIKNKYPQNPKSTSKIKNFNELYDSKYHK